MRFCFNELKSAQAASLLISLHGGKLNYMVLIKLLYLADRQTLLEHGYTITGDSFVSMPRGPVLSGIYDLITVGRYKKITPWFRYISEPKNYEVKLAEHAPSKKDELSKYETQLLEEIYRRYGSMDKWALVDLMHRLPEWEDPKGSSISIDPQTILRLEGIAPEKIEQYISHAEEVCFLDNDPV